eukprot:g5239.t1
MQQQRQRSIVEAAKAIKYLQAAVRGRLVRRKEREIRSLSLSDIRNVGDVSNFRSYHSAPTMRVSASSTMGLAGMSGFLVDFASRAAFAAARTANLGFQFAVDYVSSPTSMEKEVPHYWYPKEFYIFLLCLEKAKQNSLFPFADAFQNEKCRERLASFLQIPWKCLNSLCAGHEHSIIIRNGVAYAMGLGKYGRLGTGNENSICARTDGSEFASNVRACRWCKGKKKLGGKPCLNCSGTGKMRFDRIKSEIQMKRKKTSLDEFLRGEDDIINSIDVKDLNVDDWEDKRQKNVPQRVHLNQNILHGACGFQHSILLCKGGSVFSFGKNNSGQIGINVNTRLILNEKRKSKIGNFQTTPRKIYKFTSSTKIVNVSCGGKHSLFLSDSGEVYVCGKHHQGRLGLNINDDVFLPTKLNTLPLHTKVIQISCGDSHSLLLTKNGKVFAFGANYFGQIGSGDRQDRKIPTEIFPSKYAKQDCVVALSAGGQHSLFLLLNRSTGKTNVQACGTVYFCGRAVKGIDSFKPLKVLNLENEFIVEIDAGGLHSIVRTINNDFYSWGDNTFGQLGYTSKSNSSVAHPKKIELY